MVVMLGIDVGDHGHVGGQLEEGAVRFIGLDDHPAAAAEPRVGPVGVDDAAVDDGRVELAGIEQGRDKRGRRGLAVRAGARHAMFEAHQFGEHFGASHDGEARSARCDEFGVIAADRRRDDDHLGGADVLRLMADMHGRAPVAQALHVGVLRRVGTLHRVAEVEQHFGDAGHADAADADEMDRAEFCGQSHAGSPVPARITSSM